MKLAKALKEKNRLVEEITNLKHQLVSNNSYPCFRKPDYDTVKVLGDLTDKTNELVALKAKIGQANGPVYDKIFRLAELKGLINILTSVDTKNGKFKDPAHFGAAPQETEFVATISRSQLDELIAKYKAEIQELQDALDTYNHTTEV